MADLPPSIFSDCSHWLNCPRLSVSTVPVVWHEPTFIYSDCSYWLTCTHLYLFRLFLLAGLSPSSILSIPIRWPPPSIHSDCYYWLTCPPSIYSDCPRLFVPAVHIGWPAPNCITPPPSICSDCSYWLTCTSQSCPGYSYWLAPRGDQTPGSEGSTRGRRILSETKRVSTSPLVKGLAALLWMKWLVPSFVSYRSSPPPQSRHRILGRAWYRRQYQEGPSHLMAIFLFFYEIRSSRHVHYSWGCSSRNQLSYTGN